jgi:hypothetical protein
VSFVSIQEDKSRCHFIYIQIGKNLNIYNAPDIIHALQNKLVEVPLPMPLYSVKFQPGSFVRELTFISENKAILIEQPEGVSYSIDPIPPLRLITI